MTDIYKKRRTVLFHGRILPNAKQAMKNAYKSNDKERLLIITEQIAPELGTKHTSEMTKKQPRQYFRYRIYGGKFTLL